MKGPHNAVAVTMDRFAQDFSPTLILQNNALFMDN